MTPLKGKAPLPSSTSTVNLNPLEPKNCQEWRIALRRVKGLYFKNQWKQCATRCNDLLLQTSVSTHPLNATYLNFYAALSNEAIARSTHNLSSSKLHLLENVKESYEAAAKALPHADDHSEDDARSEKSSSSSSGASSGNSTPTPSRPNSPFYPSSPSSTGSLNEQALETEPFFEPTSPSTPTNKAQRGLNPLLSPFSTTSSASITQSQKRALRPSPLRIHKQDPSPSEPPARGTIPSPNEPSTPLAQLIPADIPALPPAPDTIPKPNEPTTPLAQLIPADVSALATTHPHSITFSTSSYLWLRTRSRERYSAHLSAFAAMLSRHIQAINNLIKSTKEAQAHRYAGKRISSCTADDEQGRKTDLRARISRLKMSGWERRVFEGERYRVLCERALSEL